MTHGDLTRISYENVETDGHNAMNDNQVEEINGKPQDVGSGHDPGQEQKKNKKEKGTG